MNIDEHKALEICQKLYPGHEAHEARDVTIDCLVTDNEYVAIVFDDELVVIASSPMACLYGISEGFKAYRYKHHYTVYSEHKIPLPVPKCYVIGGDETELDLGAIQIKAEVLPEELAMCFQLR